MSPSLDILSSEIRNKKKIHEKHNFTSFLFLKSGSARKCLPGVTWEVLCPSSSLPQQSHHRLSRCLKKNTSECIYPRFTLSYFISTSAEGSNPPQYPAPHYPASILFPAARYRKVNLCSNPSRLGKTAVGAKARLFTQAANMCVFLDVSKVISRSCFFFFSKRAAVNANKAGPAPSHHQMQTCTCSEENESLQSKHHAVALACRSQKITKQTVTDFFCSCFLLDTHKNSKPG